MDFYTDDIVRVTYCGQAFQVRVMYPSAVGGFYWVEFGSGAPRQYHAEGIELVHKAGEVPA